MGNITAQLELKKNLECKSFDWFINNIAYDMLEKVDAISLCQCSSADANAYDMPEKVDTVYANALVLMLMPMLMTC